MQSERDAVNTIVEGATEFWESNEIENIDWVSSFEQIGENLSARLTGNGGGGAGIDYDIRIENHYFKENLDERWSEQITAGVDESVWSTENSHLYEGYTRHAPFLRRRIKNDVWRDWKFWEILHCAIKAGERIRRIAQAAYLNGIAVRWFDYDPAKPEMTSSKNLHVMSAGQIARVRPNLSLFHFLSLTIVNKESLVLYSPPDSAAPGVLFCADSDLENVPLLIGENDLITVPHHGAEANEPAYDRIKSFTSAADFDSLVWVRSDSRSRKRPCQAYKSLPGRKFCTVCVTGPPKRSVIMNGNGDFWRHQKGVGECRC